jgi:outer membrane protein assembly factor BamD
MLSMHRFVPTGLLLLALILVAAGCTGGQRVISDNPEDAFNRAKRLYDEGNYTRAIEQFQNVFNYGRTSEWASDAQFYLAESYMETEQYLLAADEFTRFVNLYRQDARAEEAAFKRALAYYRLSPPYQLDQSDTRQAINYLRLFIEQYPTSEYAERAGNMLQELRNKLARGEYEAAQLYERRELFQAAALTYERVLEKYPESDWADDALLGAIQAYMRYSQASVQSRQQQRLQQALDSYHRFIELFPNSPLLEEAERLYKQARSRMDELQG